MPLEFSKLLTSLPLGILLGLFLLALVLACIAFMYHWRNYGMDTKIIRLAPTVFVIVSIVLSAFAISSYLALI